MAVDFGSLARHPLLTPKHVVFPDAGPDVLGSKHLGGDLATWVGQVVDQGEGSSAQRCWQIWADESFGDVAQDGLSVEREPLEVESGPCRKLLKLGVLLLFLCDREGIQDGGHADFATSEAKSRCA